jgi:superfamily II DNA/RNA helicase
LLIYGGLMASERAERLARFHDQPSVLVTTEAVGTELNLRDADVAIMYDGATTERRLQRVWGARDRPGRRTAPRLMVFAADQRARLPDESSLVPDSP